MESNYCYGCGYLLQSENFDALGYIDKSVKIEDNVYCKRCYNMIFRNETPKVFLDNKDYWNLFRDTLKTKALYVLVLDILNIEGTLISEMIVKLKEEDFIIVLNKRDLLPKLVNDSKIYKYVKNHVKLKGIHIKDILVVSSAKKHNIDKLLELINFYRTGNVYLVGLANVGKSSLINALVNSVMEDSREYISTSYYGGTTLGFIKIPFGDGFDLIDTPGIVSEEQLYFNKDNKILKAIIPQKEIRPKTYQLEIGQTLFITGFLELSYIKGSKQGFTVYAANQISPHRTSSKNAKSFRKEHLGKDIIVPPFDIENMEFEKHILNLHGKNVDLVINGLCFINVKGVEAGIILEIVIPKFFDYYIREGLI